MDRLLRESVYASDARAPGAETMTSVPALLRGRLVEKWSIEGGERLMIGFRGDTEAMEWSQHPNIFRRAHSLGLRTAAIGWYLPYCRVLGGDLDYCSWQPVAGLAAERRPLLTQMGYQVGCLSPLSLRESHLVKFRALLSDAIAAATNPKLDFIFVHLPVPHAPPIYDRYRQELAVFRFRYFRGGDWYFDNLALADRTLGEIRRAMEGAGLWDQTALIVSSDHFLRGPDWRTRARADQKVPFIVRLTGQSEGTEYGPALDTLLTQDLVMALLDGSVAGLQQCLDHLDRHGPQ